MKRYRWGILATGNIANSMADALRLVPDADLIAVASRSLDPAERFAAKWSIPRAYAPYEALLADPDIDIVYVATPNALHRGNILAALNAGKHVLCEKPMTDSAADTIACAQAAREAGLFLMEAMWTAFFPAMQKARALIREDAIGQPRHLRADFVSRRDPQSHPNLFNPALGGGATLDLGVYPITVSQLLAGPIARSSAQIVKGPTGVDEMVAVTALHESEAVSHLSFGFRAEMPVAVKVTGDNGTLEIPRDFHHPDALILTRNGEQEVINLPAIGNGYAHEAIEVQSCLNAGHTESPDFPLALSIRNAEMVESILSGTGNL